MFCEFLIPYFTLKPENILSEICVEITSNPPGFGQNSAINSRGVLKPNFGHISSEVRTEFVKNPRIQKFS